MGSIQQYLSLYREHRTTLDAGSNMVMNACREAAFGRLEHLSALPTKRVERYKYTSAEEAFAPDYGVNLHRVCTVADPYRTYHCSVPNLSTTLRYVIGDVVFQTPSQQTTLPEGVEVVSFAEVVAKKPDFIANFYNKIADTKDDPVTWLNTLLVQDGIVVYIPRGIQLKSPVQIVNISAAGFDMLSSRRILVIAEEDAQADILICDHSEGINQYISTEVIEVFAAERAKIGLYNLEESHPSNRRFTNIYVRQQSASQVKTGSITLTAGISRTMLDIDLVGREAMTESLGAVIADRQQHIDHNIIVSHIAESCTSNMLYKYVLDDESVGAFAGKVLVCEGAQKSYSEQTNANLCVSPTARAFTQPMLEIYADDVRCNHGSTVGKLDETALFYLRQRGVPLDEARLLLQHAFINDVLQRIEVDILRERLALLVDRRFRGTLQCDGCSLHTEGDCQ